MNTINSTAFFLQIMLSVVALFVIASFVIAIYESLGGNPRNSRLRISAIFIVLAAAFAIPATAIALIDFLFL